MGYKSPHDKTPIRHKPILRQKPPMTKTVLVVWLIYVLGVLFVIQ